jgi:exosome complex exonuclease RRP6
MKRANILKPQNSFERKPNNCDAGPWKPLLTRKPHATIPLEESLGTFVDDDQQTQYDYTTFLPLALTTLDAMQGRQKSRHAGIKQEERRLSMKSTGLLRDPDDNFRYKHPYETEILHMKYPESVYEKREPIRYLPFETTAATWVDTYDGVLEMMEELKKAKEIAIDLEHHDFRTYSGLLSLMQISTRERDWIVDTLKPWRHQLEVLNEVFADPSIIKASIPSSNHAAVPLLRFSGLPWRIHGHRLASKGPRFVCRRTFRHSPCQ